MMKKCFICGREYDETKREKAVLAVVKGEGSFISNIAKQVGNQRRVLALCKYCVKAAVVGMTVMCDASVHTFEPLEYEDEQDVETHTLQDEIPAEGFGAVEKTMEDW